MFIFLLLLLILPSDVGLNILPIANRLSPVSFFVSRHDTSLKIWDANTYEEIFSLGGHTGRISAILLTSRSKAVTGSQDCSIRFWNTKTGALNFCSVLVHFCLFLKNRL